MIGNKVPNVSHSCCCGEQHNRMAALGVEPSSVQWPIMGRLPDKVQRMLGIARSSCMLRFSVAGARIPDWDAFKRRGQFDPA